MWYQGNPCNMHLLSLGEDVKKEVDKERRAMFRGHVMEFQDPMMYGFQFNTIGVSDGMSMGTKGMMYSLPSRAGCPKPHGSSQNGVFLEEIIADSIESALRSKREAGFRSAEVMRAQFYDALVTIPGCDKNMPGLLECYELHFFL